MIESKLIVTKLGIETLFQDHTVYIFDQQNGKTDKKLPFKLPGWVVVKTLAMLKKREKMNETTLKTGLLMESNGTSTMTPNRCLGQILENPKMLDDSSSSLTLPALLESVSPQDCELQLATKLEKMQNSIDELKSLILNKK
jgi:hypothetical protein